MALETEPAKITEVITFNPQLKAIRFVPENGLFADYHPGDFLYLKIPKDKTNSSSTVISRSGRDEIRAYSLSSSPTQPFYEITVIEKEDEPHISLLLQHVESGRDTLEISSPAWFKKGKISMGKDLLCGKKLIMVGGGTGFAPFVGAARFIRDKNLENNVYLIGSFRSPEHLIFHEELLAICDMHPNVKYVPYLTRQFPAAWPYGQGRLVVRDEQGGIIKNEFGKLISDPNDYMVYVCGGGSMVKDSKEGFEILGIGKDHIHTESW